MTVQAPGKCTYHDYLKLPNGQRYELLKGVLEMTPSPSPEHQRICRRLFYALLKFLEGREIGELFCAPCDVILSTENVFQPDIFFIGKEKKAIIQATGIQGAPDLVIEIVSPSSGYRDWVTKKRLYAQFGVGEYWIVDPLERAVEIITLQGKKFETYQQVTEEDTLESPLFPGFLLSLTNIFGQFPGK